MRKTGNISISLGIPTFPPLQRGIEGDFIDRIPADLDVSLPGNPQARIMIY